MTQLPRLFHKITITLALAAGLASTAQACPVEAYVGTVCYVAGNFCPAGDNNQYMRADGTVLNVNQYQALFALIGFTYGGNNTTTFALPDLRGRSVIHWGSSTSQTTDVAYGTKRGAEKVILAPNQVPLVPHTHGATLNSASSQASGPVSLPVSVTVPALDTTVSGNVKIANSTATGGQSVSGNAVLAKGGGQATIYAPSTTAADTNIGPSQTFTGKTSVTTVNATATGTVTLPVTFSAGTVTVAPAGQYATASLSLISPQQALTACIATSGYYPQRP